MVDESTDVSVLKQLVLYGRTVAEGKLKTRFLKIVDIEDGRAATIMEAITKFFESSELEFNNLSSFGSEGASVMTGRQGGVVTLLRSKCSTHLISIHCICHRLALASGQASNNVPYLKQMKDHLIALWKYFHFSPVRSANLKGIQDVMDSPELKPLKAVDTRWLSHKAAVATLLRCLPAVLVTLQQTVNPTAVGLRTVMARYNFFASLLLLNDVLSAINRLSLIFQYSTIDFTIVPPLLNSTIESLKKMHHVSAAKFEDNVKQLITRTTTDMHGLHQSTDNQSEVSSNPSSQDPVSSTEILNDVVMIRAGEPENFEVNVRQKFLREIIHNIEERFPQVEILEAFSIFDPSGLLPHKEIASEKLEILLEHYGRNLGLQTESDHERCKEEYSEFASFVTGHATLKLCSNLRDLAEGVLSSNSISQLFPNISKLMLHALVLAVATTDCERAFSTMKRVKTDLRNRMQTKTLDQLLRIRIEGPDLSDFDFEDVVDCWSKQKNRRLFGN